MKTIRVARGLTQEQLARGASIHPSMVALIESGGRGPSYDTLVRIADALGALPEERDQLEAARQAYRALSNGERLNRVEEDLAAVQRDLEEIRRHLGARGQL